MRWSLLLLVVSLLVCLAAYLAFATAGRWFPGVETKRWSAREMVVRVGDASLSGDGLVVAPTRAPDTTIVAIETKFRSTDYPAIAWSVSGVPEKAQVRLLFRNDYAPAKMNVVQVPVAFNHLLPVTPTQQDGWIGNITGVALAIQGPLDQPVRIESVEANPMGIREVLRARIGEWLAFEPWTGSSINTLSGGADVQELPLPAFLFVAALLALAAWAAIAWRRGWQPAFPAAIGVVFLAAWLVSDARWSWNLVRQARATVAQYGGKTAEQKHLAAEDGPLYAFIEHVRAKLPGKPVRIFVAADADYFRGRAAYHLYPNNVYFYPYENALPDPGFLHPGDYVVVFQRHGIQYDAAAGLLRWDGHAPVHAQLVLLEAPGGALFRLT